jgi:hypothetical protein
MLPPFRSATLKKAKQINKQTNKQKLEINSNGPIQVSAFFNREQRILS